ncbi:UNVERIFIED_CONTAM: hypothetical protein HDU68_012778 [Siphonaria sp. JEL0065]|nr:hypothetical protein HDU68_012778 [Siphonaria sp. JEL0065]
MVGFGSQELRNQFGIDPQHLALNHGSWGCLPFSVLTARNHILADIERNPDRFYRIEYWEKLNNALAYAAKILGLETIEDLIFVANSSTGINAVLRSLKKTLKTNGKLNPSKTQKILVFSTEFFGDVNAIRHIAAHEGFGVLVVSLIFPLSDQQLLDIAREAVLNEEKEGGEIVLAVYDVIVSTPGVILPYQKLTHFFKSCDILTLVDGAQAIGQVPLDLPSFDPDYFVTNPHKWLYVPRSCALFYVNKKIQSTIVHPVVVDYREDNGDWKKSFLWPGTLDLTTHLTLPSSVAFIESLGGLEAVMEYNHNLAVKGGEIVSKILGTHVLQAIDAQDPDSNYGSMVNVLVPDTEFLTAFGRDAFLGGMHTRLLQEHNASLTCYKHGEKWWIRLSAQVYLDEIAFEKMGELLKDIFRVDR